MILHSQNSYVVFDEKRRKDIHHFKMNKHSFFPNLNIIQKKDDVCRFRTMLHFPINNIDHSHQAGETSLLMVGHYMPECLDTTVRH